MSDQQGQLNRLIERGRDFERYQIDDRRFKVVIGVPAWVRDNSGAYVPYVADVQNDHISVKSGIISSKIYPYKLEYFDADMKELRAVERLSVNIMGFEDLDLDFQDRKIIKEERSVAVSQRFSVTHVGNSIGELEITYLQEEGMPLQHIVETRNLPEGIAKSLHIKWEFPTTVDKAEICYEEGLEEQNLAVQEVTRVNLDRFESVQIVKQDRVWIKEFTSMNKTKLQEMRASNSGITWVYSGWSGQISLSHAQTGAALSGGQITYTSGPPVEDGCVTTGNATGTTCGAPSVKETTSQTLWVRVPNSANSSYCRRAYIEWNIAVVPDTATIQDIDFICHIVAPINCRNCDITGLVNRPSSTSTPSVLWADIGDGPNYVTNNNFFCTAGPNRTIDVSGNGGLADLTSKLPFDWWGIGIKFNNENRDGNDHRIGIRSANDLGANPPPRLVVTYV